MEQSKIYRAFNGVIAQQPDSESRIVEGYAVRFNEESQNIGFFETISPEAITEEVIKNSDIYARLNHNENTVLARSRYGEGTLHLELRSDGLYYRFEAPHTVDGDALLEHIRRGEICTSSFAFTVAEDKYSERWSKKDGKLCRTVYKIDRLYDISPTFEGAYLTTSCYSRDKGKAMKEMDKKVNQKMDYFEKELEKL